MDKEQIISESNFSLHKHTQPLNTLSDDDSSALIQFKSGQDKDENQTDLMYCYEHGQGDNISNISNQISPKKRKIDKDGFVTPATPDIPKSSCHFEQSNISEGLSDDVEEHFEQLVSSLRKENKNSVVTVPPEQSDQSLTPAGDLIKELGEENKNVFMQFSKLFKEREEYEMMCPEKLDKLLEQARTLEENLVQQKDILCKRLKGLSQTLKLL